MNRNLTILMAGLILLLLPSLATAQNKANFGQTIPTGELRSLLTGKTVHFDGTRLEYRSNGQYRKIGGRPESGKYGFERNRVCIKFWTRTRCNFYSRSGGKIYYVRESGRRFVVKSID